jgi:2-hydroxychromene-2-carboxylate isomerase
MPSVVHFFDYKSPYAFLAQEETFELNDEIGGTMRWVPYTLDIPSYLGAAELDSEGRDIVGMRNEHQWRRVRYAYMDCRREAARRGLTLRGPPKIYDSSIAHIGFLYARSRGDFRRYHDEVFTRFWRRELDIEDAGVIESLLTECGVDARGFRDFLAGEGRRLHDENQRDAESRGVFGVPSYLVDDELFWGNERIPRVREALGLATTA